MDALNSRSSRLSASASLTRVNPFTVRIAALYSEIWTLLAASRFCLFFAVSFFIYQSKPGAWGFDLAATGDPYGSRSATEAVSGLDQLKNRVVFTYGFMEMMFWLWVSRSGTSPVIVQAALSYLSNGLISLYCRSSLHSATSDEKWLPASQPLKLPTSSRQIPCDPISYTYLTFLYIHPLFWSVRLQDKKPSFLFPYLRYIDTAEAQSRSKKHSYSLSRF
jgi:hypothetical protein